MNDKLPGIIDFSKGGYKGDVIEEVYKPFTGIFIPCWWQFREVLRASHLESPHWQKADGTKLGADEQKELVAISLMNYHVYTGLVEAIAFHEQLVFEVNRTTLNDWRLFDVRRFWKALYSSLYGSFNALANIICVMVGQNSVFGNKPGKIWNYTPSDAKKLAKSDAPILIPELENIEDALQLRSQLDHYWLIWHSVAQGKFLIDNNFAKGHVPLDIQQDTSISVDATQLARNHLLDCANNYNVIYYELSKLNGFLDKFLLSKGWMIDYSDYGAPHNAKRPKYATEV